MATLKSSKVTKRNDITVGCDPEVFFTKEGKPFPAIGLVGGNKLFPRKLDVGAVQEDNVMAEFNIPPATTEKEFSANVARMLENVRKIAEKHGCSLYISPYAEFENHYLQHPQAQNIGCDPDYSAWEMRQNNPISHETLGYIRTASGHVHVGWPTPDRNPYDRYAVIKSMDLYLGVPSVLMDSDVTRRKYYGKAGAFRPKVYGAEYRVMSNFWIKEENYRKWVFNNTVLAVNTFSNVRIFEREDKYFQHIRRCIDTGNKQLAVEIIRHFNIPMPAATNLLA